MIAITNNSRFINMSRVYKSAVVDFAFHGSLGLRKNSSPKNVKQQACLSKQVFVGP